MLGDCLAKITLLTRFVKKHGHQGAWLIFPYIHIVKLQTTSRPKPLGQMKPNFIGMFLGWFFLKLAKRNEIHEELWLPWQPIEKDLENQLKLNRSFKFKLILQK